MNKKEYIEKVLNHISGKAQKSQAEYELSDHIDDRKNYYIDCGIDREQAEIKAVEKMGDPDRVGIEFNRLHRNSAMLFIAVIFNVLYVLLLLISLSARSEFFIVPPASLWKTPETNSVVCFVSTLGVALSLAAIAFSYKSKNNVILIITGVTQIISFVAFPIFSMPFAYTIAGLIFCFPFTVQQGETFFGDCAENLIYSTVNAIVFILLLYILTSFALINGVASLLESKNIIYLKDKKYSKRDKQFKRYLSFITVIFTVGVIALSVEAVYDNYKNEQIQQSFNDEYAEDYLKAQDVFESINLPLSKNESDKIVKSHVVSNDDLQYYKDFNTIVLYDNDVGAIVTIADEDSDGILETMIYDQMLFDNAYCNSYNFADDIKIGITIDEFKSIYYFSDYNTYEAYYNGSTKFETIELVRYYQEEEINFLKPKSDYADEISYTFYFENGVLTDKDKLIEKDVIIF